MTKAAAAGILAVISNLSVRGATGPWRECQKACPGHLAVACDLGGKQKCLVQPVMEGTSQTDRENHKNFQRARVQEMSRAGQAEARSPKC